MNGYLRVNTFLRDVAFINCQNIKTVYFHVTYFEARKKDKYQVNTMLYQAPLGLLRDEATRRNKKLLGIDWTDLRFCAIMNSYVTAWGVCNEANEKVLHIYASNRPIN